MFGLGSLPAGRLGDLWGRRAMMIVFFLGMGVAALLIALTARRLAAGGRAHADGRVRVHLPSGRHPDARAAPKQPGLTIGVNGLAGNLGIAVAALLTGFLVKYFGWRAAFAVPGARRHRCGIVFALRRAARGDGAGQARAEAGATCRAR